MPQIYHYAAQITLVNGVILTTPDLQVNAPDDVPMESVEQQLAENMVGAWGEARATNGVFFVGEVLPASGAEKGLTGLHPDQILGMTIRAWIEPELEHGSALAEEPTEARAEATVPTGVGFPGFTPVKPGI